MKYPLRKMRRPRQMLDEWRGQRAFQRDRELWAGMQPALARSQSTGCTFHELGILYRHIVEQQPKAVLELGSGVSTIVLGYAARRVREQGAPCRITSLEESAHYRDDLAALIPPAVADCIDLILSPVRDEMVAPDRIGRSYRDVPEAAYGMVFVDGPQVPEAKNDGRYFDADLLRVLDWNEGPFVAYIDGRQSTRANLAALMPWAAFTYDNRHRFSRVGIPAIAERRHR